MIAIGLDLGSTRIKAGRLAASGELHGVQAIDAPALRGTAGVREGDAAAYVAQALGVLAAVARDAPPGTPLGIATQRSTFVVWDRESGVPRTPMVSWQDRRAADWCARHRDLDAEIVRRTGLPLSAHYAGPKLAAMQEADAALGWVLRSGDCLLGTLETFLVWSCSVGRVHETDLSVAARTLMVDLASGDWSDELLGRFAVPRSVLPAIAPGGGRAVPLGSGLRLAASVADQAAGVLAVLEEGEPSALVNLGTGAFVLRPAESDTRRPGYLTAPVLDTADGRVRYTLEGTINGAGPALDRFAPDPVELPHDDPAPDAFAVPDLAGLGSPYWRPEIGLTLSDAARGLDGAGRRLAVLEGLLFRIAGILDELFDGEHAERLLLAGGATYDPGIAAGLATLVGRPVEVLAEHESGLTGVARLAAGLAPYAGARSQRVDPGAGAYLRAKRARWQAWLRGQVFTSYVISPNDTKQ